MKKREVMRKVKREEVGKKKRKEVRKKKREAMRKMEREVMRKREREEGVGGRRGSMMGKEITRERWRRSRRGKLKVTTGGNRKWQ